MSIKSISFLGLGVMGHPMAGHLATKTDLNVTIYNRTFAKAEAWTKQYKGNAARTPADAARDADIIFVCVGNDQDLEYVLTGTGGVIETVKPGASIIDHTTVSADISRRMYETFKGKGVSFMENSPLWHGRAPNTDEARQALREIQTTAGLEINDACN